MINNNILGLIGLAMKAGKVAFGADSVEESILKRKVKLVIVSKESSERTKSKFSKICEKYNIPIIIDGNIEEKTFDNLTIIEHINIYIEDNLTPKEAIKKVAKERNIPKSEVYNEYNKNKS